MRIRTFVTSAALFTALLSSSALVTEAMAQKGEVNSPISEWAVTKINDTGGAYCALARKYTQNTVMTFAQNTSNETSFALDFQRPVFSAGAKTSVLLDPGAGQMRSYDIQPFSNKALVVRLGRDDAFFKALDQTGFLRVEVGGKSYHFSIADISDGRGRLDGCIAAMVMPAAGDELESAALTPEPSVSGAKPAQNASQARLQIEDLQAQIAGLKQQNRKLGQSLSSVGAPPEPSSAVSELSTQLKTLGDENETLRQQLEAAKAPSPVTTIRSEQDPATEDLVAENLRLKAQIQTLKPGDEEIASLESQIDELKIRNADLQQKIQKVDSANTDAENFARKIEELSAQNAALEEEIAAAKTQADDGAAQRMEELLAENANLKSTMDKKGVDADLLDQLRQQIGKVENENRLLKETAAQASNEITLQKSAELQDLRAQSEEKIAGLENQLEMLKAESQQKDRDMVEIGSNSAELETLKAENTELQQRLAAQEGADELKAKIAELQAENFKLSENIEKATLDKPEQADTVAALEAENQQLKQELASASTDNAQVLSLQAQLEDANGRIAELEGAAEIAANTPAEDSVSGEAEQKIAALEDRNEKLKSALENLIPAAEGYKAKYQTKLEEVRTLEVRNAELAAKIDETQTLADARAQELEGLKAQTSASAEIAPQQPSEEDLSAAQTEPASGGDADKISALEDELKAMAVENRELKNTLEKSAEAEKEQKQALAKLKEQADGVEPESERSSIDNEAPLPEPEMPLEAPQKRAAITEPATQKIVLIPPPARKPASELAVNEMEQSVALIEPSAGPDAAPLPEPEMPLDAPQSSTAKALTPQQAAANEAAAKAQKSQNADAELAEAIARDEAEQASKSRASSPAPVAPSPQQAAAAPAPVALQQPTTPQPEFGSELNEAQKQEMAVRQNVEAKKSQAQIAAAAVSPPKPAQIQTPKSEILEAAPTSAMIEAQPLAEKSEPLAVHQSEDPYADIEVTNAGDAEKKEAVETVSAEAAPAMPPQEALSAPVAAQTQQTAAAPAAGGSIIDVLSMAGASGVQKVDKASEGDKVAYQWQNGQVFGTAEEKAMGSPDQFDVMVKDYLDRTQQRCPGEFAVVPDDSVGEGDARADSYEVACVGKSVSSGASLLFYNKGGVFTVVAHEAPATDLGQAIDSRNQVKKLVTGS
jgi:hypothetical protein